MLWPMRCYYDFNMITYICSCIFYTLLVLWCSIIENWACFVCADVVENPPVCIWSILCNTPPPNNTRPPRLSLCVRLHRKPQLEPPQQNFWPETGQLNRSCPLGVCSWERDKTTNKEKVKNSIKEDVIRIEKQRRLKVKFFLNSSLHGNRLWCSHLVFPDKCQCSREVMSCQRERYGDMKGSCASVCSEKRTK